MNKYRRNLHKLYVRICMKYEVNQLPRVVTAPKSRLELERTPRSWRFSGKTQKRRHERQKRPERYTRVTRDIVFMVGDKVRVVKEFKGDGEKRLKIGVGMVGRIQAIDDDGDMAIEFEEFPAAMPWVSQQKVRNLRKHGTKSTSKASDYMHGKHQTKPKKKSKRKPSGQASRMWTIVG